MSVRNSLLSLMFCLFSLGFSPLLYSSTPIVKVKSMQQISIQVQGMTCEMCAASIKAKFSTFAKENGLILTTSVDVEAGLVTLQIAQGQQIGNRDIENIIRSAGEGYKISSVKYHSTSL